MDKAWLDDLLETVNMTTLTASLTEAGATEALHFNTSKQVKTTTEAELATQNGRLAEAVETTTLEPATNAPISPDIARQSKIVTNLDKPTKILTRLRVAVLGIMVLLLVAGLFVFFISTDNTAAINGQILGKIQGIAVNAMAFSRNGRFLLSADGDYTVKVLSVEPEAAPSGNLVEELREHTNYVYALKYSWDGKLLATASTDKTIKIWEIGFDGIPTKKVLLTINVNTPQLWSLAFSPDDKVLASAGANNTILLWDVATGTLLKTLSGHTGKVWELAFSRDGDGSTLASSSQDKTIKLWNINTGQLLKTLTGHTGSVQSISFNPTGKILASGSADGTVKIWDVDSGKELTTLKGHLGQINSVVFSPDGQLLASAGIDDLIKLWDVSSWKEIKTLKGHTNAQSITCLAFSLDGNYLASGSEKKEGVIRWWKVR